MIIPNMGTRVQFPTLVARTCRPTISAQTWTLLDPEPDLRLSHDNPRHTIGVKWRRPVKTYEFTLKFSIPDMSDKEDIEERLFKAGCEDALVATGLRDRLALDFSRQSRSAEQAINSALKAVAKALPEASLIGACPDLVGVSDIAELLSF